MIDLIEKKIEKHIEYILAKEPMTHDDYMTLTNELCRLNMKAKEEAQEKNSKEMQEIIQKMYLCGIKSTP